MAAAAPRRHLHPRRSIFDSALNLLADLLFGRTRIRDRKRLRAISGFVMHNLGFDTITHRLFVAVARLGSLINGSQSIGQLADSSSAG